MHAYAHNVGFSACSRKLGLAWASLFRALRFSLHVEVFGMGAVISVLSIFTGEVVEQVLF